MNIEPEQIAEYIMNYYILNSTSSDSESDESERAGVAPYQGPSPSSFKTDIVSNDNELIVQILLSIYKSMHLIWYKYTSLKEDTFLNILELGMNMLGFDIMIEPLLSDDLIYYASIDSSENMFLNPFHPFHIAYLIKDRLPDSYKDLLYNPFKLSQIKSLHNHSNGTTDIVYFRLL